jgi:integrase
MTVHALIDSYLAKHVRPNLRSAAAIKRRFAKNVTPIIGNINLADLHKREINRVVDPILERGKSIEAARCFEDMRAMFRWAVARGDLDHNPMEGMRKPVKAKPRERVLSDAEIAQLWNGLPEALPRSKTVQRIVKLCLLTAQRVGEVSGVTADEIDLRARLWTIPGKRTKNGHKHTVPLSKAAIAVIEECDGSTFLFPNDDGEGSLLAHAVAKTITRAQERFGLDHWTAHDLRRSAVTHMAELGVSPIVLGHVINHRSVTRAGTTLSVYQQYDYAKEKRHALELWAERLTAIVGEGAAKVLPMRGMR